MREVPLSSLKEISTKPFQNQSNASKNSNASHWKSNASKNSNASIESYWRQCGECCRGDVISQTRVVPLPYMSFKQAYDRSVYRHVENLRMSFLLLKGRWSTTLPLASGPCWDSVYQHVFSGTTLTNGSGNPGLLSEQSSMNASHSQLYHTDHSHTSIQGPCPILRDSILVDQSTQLITVKFHSDSLDRKMTREEFSLL